MKRIMGVLGALAICWSARAAYAETLTLALYKDANNELISDAKVVSETGGHYRIRPGGGGSDCDSKLYCEPGGGGGGMIGRCESGKRISLGFYIGNGDPNGLLLADYDASADVSANDFGMCTAHVNTWKNQRFFIRRGGSWGGNNSWGSYEKLVGIYYGKCLNPSCGLKDDGTPDRLEKVELTAELYKVDTKTQTETKVMEAYAELSVR